MADRGYASKAIIRYLVDNKINFLFRLQSSFNAEIDESTESDFVWNMVDKRGTVPIRVLKFELPNDEIETLTTNLFDQTLTTSDFVKFYTSRQGIEMRYNLFKNVINIEEFSGKSRQTLEQDFYARVFLMNVEAAIKAETDAIITKRDEGKKLKYPRKTNETILIGILKREFASILFEEDISKRQSAI